MKQKKPATRKKSHKATHKKSHKLHIQHDKGCCKDLDMCRISLALGIFGAISIMLLSLSYNLFGLAHPIISIIGSMYKGFNASLPGTIIGMIWGFADFYVAGVGFVFIYNKLGRCNCCKKSN